MTKFQFDRIVTPEEIKDMVEKALGSGFRIGVKKNRIEIVQDAARGCVIQVREGQGRTVCKGPYGYMPSGGLRAAIVLAAFALLFIIGQAMGYLVFGIGVLPMVILILIMKAPSQELVKRVAGILEKVARKEVDKWYYKFADQQKEVDKWYYKFADQQKEVDKWYYKFADQQIVGPVSKDTLKERVQKGELPPNTLVRWEGLTGWVEAKTIHSPFVKCEMATVEARASEGEAMKQEREYSEMYCPQCGSAIGQSDRLCAKCGTTLQTQTEQDSHRKVLPATTASFEPSPASFRDPTKLTRWLKYFLYASIAIYSIAFFSGVLQYQLLTDFKLGVYTSEALATAAAESNDKRQQIVGIFQFAIVITTAVLFFMWIYRANYNARQLGAKGMTFTPGWAVGWYFVPIASLWKPYQAMKEIWKASKTPLAWENEQRGGILPWWWFFFLVGSMLGAAFRTTLRARDLNELIVSTSISLAFDLVSITATIVALILVGKIFQMQMSHVQPRI